MATDAARDFWERTAAGATAPEEVAAAADRMCTELRASLSRWIGTGGYRALLDRALGVAREEHSALASLSCHGGDEPAITVAVRAHGATELAAAMVALVAGLIELLGHIIGEQMALRLVEQSGVPTPRGVVSLKMEGKRSG